MNKFLSKGVASTFLAVAALGVSSASFSITAHLGASLGLPGEGVLKVTSFEKKKMAFGLRASITPCYMFTDYLGAYVSINGGMDLKEKRKAKTERKDGNDTAAGQGNFTEIHTWTPAAAAAAAAAPVAAAGAGIAGIGAAAAAPVAAAGAAGAGGIAAGTYGTTLGCDIQGIKVPYTAAVAFPNADAVKAVLDKIELEKKHFDIGGELGLRVQYSITDDLRFTSSLGGVLAYNSEKWDVLHEGKSLKDGKFTYGSIDPSLTLGLEYSMSESISLGGYLGARTRGLGCFSKKVDGTKSNDKLETGTEFMMQGGLSLTLSL